MCNNNAMFKLYNIQQRNKRYDSSFFLFLIQSFVSLRSDFL